MALKHSLDTTAALQERPSVSTAANSTSQPAVYAFRVVYAILNA
jgi:hypothetical protein